ncbi:3-deoxy-D-manno-octulosonic acid kinase [Vibrio sp. HA2012]|uniref:3-deoxy-D-manno-octulosonic acid kinase n=1 Tax=Vibrio sp. HA2012 TaxID=1971595 RepID=UPI000C2B74F2|nr:3-deoxy-D-manno-octulosonic acid kinase [Vibrio sp. HA2012]PJC85224.1 3-deoxy-D-manno-octulosonic acid kinase [Vibrio sp. HA2012]
MNAAQYKQICKKNECIWYDDTLLSESPEDCFELYYWQSSGKVIGSAQGRGTTWFVQLEKLQGALRHYRRGGLFGKLINDHYLFSGWEQTRSYQEFQLLKHLADAGVRVPRPLAAKVRRGLFTYQADLLSERIQDARDLVSILKTEPLSADRYQSIGREIRKMHNAGVNHTDLNIHNLLCDSHEKVWIIDFDKCCQQAGERWKSANLDRLLRSFRKEKDKHDIFWEENDFNALLAGYQE